MSRDRTIVLLLAVVTAGPVAAAGCEKAADAAAARADCTEAADAQAPAADPAAGYRKKTPYDNTPYRFNAQKGFTAAEFDAWMQARGIRIAGGKPAEAAPPVAAAQPIAAEAGPTAQPVADEAGAVPVAQESAAVVNCIAGQTAVRCFE